MYMLALALIFSDFSFLSPCYPFLYTLLLSFTSFLFFIPLSVLPLRLSAFLSPTSLYSSFGTFPVSMILRFLPTVYPLLFFYVPLSIYFYFCTRGTQVPISPSVLSMYLHISQPFFPPGDFVYYIIYLSPIYSICTFPTSCTPLPPYSPPFPPPLKTVRKNEMV